MINQIQKQLSKNKIDALFITDPYNIRYLSGFTGSNGQIVVTRKKAWLITDFRYIAVAKKILPREIKMVEMNKGLIDALQKLITKNRIKTLGFEDQNITFAKHAAIKKRLAAKAVSPSKQQGGKKCTLKPTYGLVEKLRIIKTPKEVLLITKAQRIAEKVFMQVRKNLKVGKTEQQIAWEIEKLGKEFGADTISFPPIVGFQQNSASPHHQNTDRKLKKGDVVLIDMGMQYRGYCSDMTRMIFTKKPSALEAKIYNLVLEAQEKSIKGLRAGIEGFVADKWARDIITKAGYGKTFGHSLGHGIGLEVHEGPSLSVGYDKPIPEGTIVTSEPGIYLKDSFGVRIEDMVLIKRDRIVNLTKIPKKLEDSIFLIR